MRIKTRGDNDQIRRETRRHLLERRLKPALVLDRRRGRAQRQIQRRSKPASSSLLTTRTRPRIPRILVRRKEVHRRIGVENSLRAVAVMNVPIDDRDLLDLRVLLLRVTRRNRDVVEKTKPHRAFFSRMMSGGTYRYERVLHFARHDQIDRLARRARRTLGRVE